MKRKIYDISKLIGMIFYRKRISLPFLRRNNIGRIVIFLFNKKPILFFILTRIWGPLLIETRAIRSQYFLLIDSLRNITIVNNDNFGPSQFISWKNFRIYTSQGSIHADEFFHHPSAYHHEDIFIHIDLDAGSSISGTLVFHILEGSEPISLTLEYGYQDPISIGVDF